MGYLVPISVRLHVIVCATARLIPGSAVSGGTDLHTTSSCVPGHNKPTVDGFSGQEHEFMQYGNVPVCADGKNLEPIPLPCRRAVFRPA
jgi:hypothetical protein